MHGQQNVKKKSELSSRGWEHSYSTYANFKQRELKN